MCGLSSGGTLGKPDGNGSRGRLHQHASLPPSPGCNDGPIAALPPLHKASNKLQVWLCIKLWCAPTDCSQQHSAQLAQLWTTYALVNTLHNSSQTLLLQQAQVAIYADSAGNDLFDGRTSSRLDN